MHVLVIPSWYPSHEYPTNGIFFRQQARGLCRRGLKVAVVAPVQYAALHLPAELLHSRRLTVQDDHGLVTYGCYTCGWFPGLRRANLMLWLRWGRRLFRRYLADHGRPDLIHAHVATQAGLLAAWIKRQFGIPYVLSEHTSLYQRRRIPSWQVLQLREVFSQAGARTMVSPALAAAVEQTVGQAALPWSWLPNLVEQRFHELPISPRPDAASKFTFLHLASLFAVKGQAELIRAFASEFAGRQDVELRIGGDGPLRRRLERLAAELGVEQQVRFLGLLSRGRVLDEMRRSDAFVLSSRSETFAVVLIEALACGKPVVATACGGPQCIVNEHNGLLVPVGDVQAMADAMAMVRRNRNRYDDQAIRRDCIERFSEDAVLGKLVELFHEVLGLSEP